MLIVNVSENLSIYLIRLNAYNAKTFILVLLVSRKSILLHYKIRENQHDGIRSIYSEPTVNRPIVKTTASNLQKCHATPNPLKLYACAQRKQTFYF